MRIKDWSSDVCASDLIVEAGLDLQIAEAGPQPDAELVRIGRLETVVQETKLAAATRRRPREQLVPTRLGQIHWVERHAGADRKSVVSGQRVPVREDLGGRRNNKKNKNI